MNVLHLISSEGYYGAEAMLVELAAQQAELGWRVVIGVFRDVRYDHTEVADAARGRGLPVEIISCRGRCDLKVPPAIRKAIDEQAIEVLHTHGYKTNFYARMAADPARTARVATCHNWPSRKPAMVAYAMLDRRLLRSFDQVVAVSDSVAAILRRSGLPAYKLTTILNGVDVGRFAGCEPVLRSQFPWAKRPLVGFVGRLVEKKGGAVLLRAAQKILNTYPDVIFVFAGEGPQRAAWEALAVELGIARSVAFLGARNDMPAIYSSLDLLALPSFEEASPLCLLEAQAAGVPTVATRVGGVTRQIVPGVTGLLVEPGDDESLARAILRLLADPDFARRLGDSGQRRVSREFSARGMAAKYLEVYRHALITRPERLSGRACPSPR